MVCGGSLSVWLWHPPAPRTLTISYPAATSGLFSLSLAMQVSTYVKQAVLYLQAARCGLFIYNIRRHTSLWHTAFSTFALSLWRSPLLRGRSDPSRILFPRIAELDAAYYNDYTRLRRVARAHLFSELLLCFPLCAALSKRWLSQNMEWQQLKWAGIRPERFLGLASVLNDVTF